jgi:type I restriction-modification system DNA methylase subunit
MPLFQNSVVQKQLNNQDKSKLETQWNVFKNHFHNSHIQENIRNSKEEQYQGEFLIDLFVNVLGYTKNPSPNFTLTTEYKNVKDSKKADGAILVDDKVRAVIELKGTNTTDLNKIEAQAFGYKNNQPDCIYVITSNFEKIRFYIDNAIEHLEFNLFKLNKAEFELLYLCLAYENIKNNIAKSIKDQSVSEEDVITKKLYKDYSLFKRELFQNLVELNPQYDSLELFQKSQKLLDRFLFIFFAEDRNLLPTNLIFRINKEWQQLQEMRIPVSLYDRYKTYFSDLNTGAKVSLPAFSQTNSSHKEEHQIFAYNGGLFKEDDLLNSLIINDQILFEHTEKLSNYDFASEVDVNILGHIFENSLNELDEVKAQLEGQDIDKTKTKRKKDGVFYTPKYITKYIVENTVGKLCTEKKNELGIIEEDYIIDKKRQKKTLQALIEKLDIYRKWLLELSICDPACGSGAFLNQALDFLIAEHQYLDELQAKLFGDALVLSDIATSILENNLFGVDLNEESVEIAKLSLWLRTAKPNRKLNNLNSNIKCGNSLIDDPEVAGDKAFNWKSAFPNVFNKGGFDVIIGNPPYGAKLDSETQNYLNKKYIKGGSETVISFTKLSYDTLLKTNGQFGFIIPKSFSFSSNYESIRNYILNDINEIIDCKKVWKEVLLEQIIFFFQKGKKTENFKSGILQGQQIKNLGQISKNTFKEFGFYLNGISEAELKIGQKVNSTNKYIKDIANNSRGGIFQNKINEEGDISVLGGAEIQREGIIGIKGLINKSIIQDDKKCFINQNSVLVQRLIAHIENPKEHIKITACFPLDINYAIVDTINQITFKKEYSAKVFWCLFNSELINWYCFRFILAKAIRTMQFDNPITNRIPIPDTFNQLPFIQKADQMLSLNKDLQDVSQKFQRSLERKFNLTELPKKLQDWYLLSYSEFIKELGKKKVVLSLVEEAEWEDYFLQESKKALDLKAQIDQTDKEIDQMVYVLYGLSEEEIRIVEGS